MNETSPFGYEPFVTSGDFNGDGLEDVVITKMTFQAFETYELDILLNDGNESLVLGTSSVFSGTVPAVQNPRQVVIADFNGFDSSDSAHDIQPVDLNGDAYVDLFVVYERQPSLGSYIQALVNNQDGTFRDETLSRLEPLDRQVWIPSLALRDLDRDGDPDLLAKPWDDQDPNPLLFLNDGGGHFSREPLDFRLTYLYYTFLDLDGDDGHDLVFATFAPPEDIYAVRDLGCPVFLPFVCRNHSAQ